MLRQGSDETDSLRAESIRTFQMGEPMGGSGQGQWSMTVKESLI